jgi:hypothetical protein
MEAHGTSQIIHKAEPVLQPLGTLKKDCNDKTAEKLLAILWLVPQETWILKLEP